MIDNDNENNRIILWYLHTLINRVGTKVSLVSDRSLITFCGKPKKKRGKLD